VSKPDVRQRIGREAAKEVRENWLWPKIVKKMRAVYSDVEAADS